MDAIPYDFSIPAIARQIVIAGGGDCRQPMVGFAQSQKELDAVRKAAAALAGKLDALHEPARKALDEMGGQTIRWMKVTLAGLEAAAAHAKIPPIPPFAGQGRPTKSGPSRITKIVGLHYARLAGKRPTISVSTQDGHIASGPFLDVLAEIFAAFRMNASPEACARKFIAGMEKTTSKK
jgi:hypothetical protein